MPYAKVHLYVGSVCIARPGHYVTQIAVDRYHWHDDVSEERTVPIQAMQTVELPKVAPKGRRRKA